MTTIQPSTLEFLTELSVNNNRDWFAEHKPRYEVAKAEIKTFGNALLDEMNKIDHIDKLKFHRIYRDVRFSKDKTPYSCRLSGSMSERQSYFEEGIISMLSLGIHF